jgi:predicted GIY-YIG superfamily endonuclease
MCRHEQTEKPKCRRPWDAIQGEKENNIPNRKQGQGDTTGSSERKAVGKEMNLNTTMAVVYLLIDCRSGDPFYVGSSVNLKSRMSSHRVSTNKTKVASRIREIEASGSSVFTTVAFSGCLSMCAQLEKKFISIFKEGKIDICNKVIGGRREHNKKAFIPDGTGELSETYSPVFINEHGYTCRIVTKSTYFCKRCKKTFTPSQPPSAGDMGRCGKCKSPYWWLERRAVK